MTFNVFRLRDNRWMWSLDDGDRVEAAAIRPEASRAVAIESARIFAREVAAALAELEAAEAARITGGTGDSEVR
jgi:hypothetical protein